MCFNHVHYFYALVFALLTLPSYASEVHVPCLSLAYSYDEARLYGKGVVHTLQMYIMCNVAGEMCERLFFYSESCSSYSETCS